ncbi:DUF1127 domain-containing protein [Mycobacterium sp. KBS0706]|uniref:DUF1127 domain-containing protein n=1 Tax=Mycobacterium sp. KBS0706 TaxID=2578109 RepID=UPI00163D6727|nr:DUF1127 domain-containing protein [Mycobacterium sp. KBS0706]
MISTCLDERRSAPSKRPTPVLSLLSHIAALPALWYARIQTRSRMQRMDDDTLLDLGLRRDQVETMHRKPFWRE